MYGFGGLLPLCPRRRIKLMHALIYANPQHEYVLWIIGAKAEDAGKFKYELAPNVKEVRGIFDDALRLHATKSDYYHFSKQQMEEMRKMVLCQDPDWNVLSHVQSAGGRGAFLMSETFLNILLDICENDYPYVEFADFFHSIRSMFLCPFFIC